MARAAIRQIVIGVAVSGLLAGCVDGGNPFAAAPATEAGSTAAPAFKPSAKGNRDVEAPDVFSVSETALWDGRPSLGGVWVASPDTKDPERVIMRNTANGQTVVGALFRRERDNPGPKLQISSDAAEALGLLAGQPAEISVTALRREEVAEPVAEPVMAAAAEAPKDGTAKPSDAATAIDTTAIATAALDKVDGKPAAAAEQPVAAAPVKETRKTRRQKAAEAKAAAAAAAGVPLDATATVAGSDTAAAPLLVPEKPKTRKELRAEAAAAKRAAAEAASAAAATVGVAALPATAAPAPAAASEGRPIQIGFFSEEANANRAVAALGKAGVPATARREESSGKVYWTVTARGDAAVLKKAKAAGFADAYFLK